MIDNLDNKPNSTSNSQDNARQLMQKAEEADADFDFSLAYRLFIQASHEFDNLKDTNQANLCLVRAATCLEKFQVWRGHSALWEYFGNRLGNMVNSDFKFTNPNKPGQSDMYHIISWQEWKRPENGYYGDDTQSEQRHQQAWAYMWGAEEAEAENRHGLAGKLFRKSAISWELSKWGDILPRSNDNIWTKDRLERRHGNKWRLAARFYFQAVYNLIQDKGKNPEETYLFLPYEPHQIGWGSKSSLFSWSDIPGNDNNRLLSFLKDELDINWADNAEIIKKDQDRTIHVQFEEKSIDIILDEKKEKAVVIFDNQRLYDFQAREKNGKLNIYRFETAYEKADDIDRMIRCWRMYGEEKKDYLFTWDEIPGKDTNLLIEFLIKTYDLDWIRKAIIEKINNEVIKVSLDNKSITLRLIKNKTIAKVRLSFGRTDELIVENENGKLRLYRKNVVGALEECCRQISILLDQLTHIGKRKDLTRLYRKKKNLELEVYALQGKWTHPLHWAYHQLTGSGSNLRRTLLSVTPLYIFIFPLFYFLGGWLKHGNSTLPINFSDAVIFSVANTVSVSISDYTVDGYIGYIIRTLNGLSAYFVLGYTIWLMTRSFEE